MFVTAIIAAGGQGQRFRGDRPKQLVEIGGRPILERSVSAFLHHPSIGEVVVALPPELVNNPPSYLGGTRIVAGGERRQDSVANAFAASSHASDIVVVNVVQREFHDLAVEPIVSGQG